MKKKSVKKMTLKKSVVTNLAEAKTRMVLGGVDQDIQPGSWIACTFFGCNYSENCSNYCSGNSCGVTCNYTCNCSVTCLTQCAQITCRLSCTGCI